MLKQAPRTRDDVKKASLSRAKSRLYVTVVGIAVLTVMMLLFAFQFMAPLEDPVWPAPSQPSTHSALVQML